MVKVKKRWPLYKNWFIITINNICLSFKSSSTGCLEQTEFTLVIFVK